MVPSRATCLLSWALLAAFIQTLAACLASTTSRRHIEPYLVGVGKADITGPVSDIQMMGYANPDQIAGGLHTRLWARSFIVVDRDTGNRVVFVNLDACMASQAVTFTVIDRLQAIYGPSVYSADNMVLSGTHTHSGPAGYLQYLIYDITGLGFVKETFDALVEGIVLSIIRAHEGLAPGRLRAGKTRVDGANVNRSPTAYVKNPQWERDMYEDDVDKEMTLLRFEDEEGRGIGAFSWFAVHGTSMNNTNRLINGDNKGAAALFMEEEMGNGFVAAFCQANVGDTSPNTLGAFCMDTGLPCDAVHSTCDGRVQQCIGRGPGWPDHFESTRIVASKQHDAAVRLFEDDDGLRSVSGAVESMHVYLDMSNVTVGGRAGVRAGKTCKPAMGFSFAAGTTDGPGAFDFQQSDTHGSAFWRLVRDFITTPTEEQERCHAPKPILLDVGEMHYPYEWAPTVVEISIIRIGNFVILAVPGELTTMSGRRLVRTIGEKVNHAWGVRGGSSDTGNAVGDRDGKERHLHIVIGGLSNTYSSYVTTFEEYQEQRYEGGFTLFGPHTLDAYIQEFARLADCMIGDGSNGSDGEEQRSGDSGDLNMPCDDPGPRPPNLLDDQWSLVPDVVVDAVPWGARFGETTRDVEKRMYRPGDIVEVEFRAASPRNDFKMGDTYLQVERLATEMIASMSFWGRLCRSALRLVGLDRATSSARWVVEYTDSSWSTQYEWQRRTPLSPLSYATVRWSIPSSVTGGLYRIRYLGTSKNLLGQLTDFEGTSGEFQVTVTQ